MVKKYMDVLSVAGRSKETIYCYLKTYKVFGEFIETKYNSMMYFEDITFEDVEEFFKYGKEEKNLSQYTLKQYRGRLKILFDYAISKQAAVKNIVSDYPRIRAKQKEKKGLSEEEAKLIIDNIENKTVKMIVEILYYCGLRTSEAMNIELKDIDFKNEIIAIRKTKSPRERSVPMPSRIKKLLEEYIENDREKVNSELLFVNHKATLISKSMLLDKIKKAQKNSGLEHKEVSPHIFRHSFATNLLRKNINVRIIQNLLGHAHMSATITYLHSSREELKQAVDLL